MSGDGWTALAFLCIFLAMVGLVVWSEIGYVRENPPPEISSRPHHDAAIAPAPHPCAATGLSPRVHEAHRITQLHADHRCPRKVEALTALVQAGRMTPDTHRRALAR